MANIDEKVQKLEVDLKERIASLEAAIKAFSTADLSSEIGKLEVEFNKQIGGFQERVASIEGEFKLFKIVVPAAFTFVMACVLLFFSWDIHNVRAHVTKALDSSGLDEATKRINVFEATAKTSAGESQKAANSAITFAGDASTEASKINSILGEFQGSAITRIASDIYRVPDKQFTNVSNQDMAGDHMKFLSPLITFGRQFKHPPVVLLSVENLDIDSVGPRIYTICTPIEVSNTGFRIKLGYLPPGRITGNTIVKWIALGD